MRYALFSDIHGEMVALQAVLADAATRQIDQYLCLGDICDEECMQVVNGLNAPTVFGNWEVMIAELAIIKQTWLLNLPPLLKLPHFWAAHADPIWSPDVANLVTYIASDKSSRPTEVNFPCHNKLTPRLTQSMAALQQAQVPLFFYGHIHEQRVWQQEPSGHISELPARPFTLQPDHIYMVSIGNVTPTIHHQPVTYAIFDSLWQQVELLTVAM
jgi:predicted phosphodiesterase